MALPAAVSLVAGFTRTTRAALAIYTIARAYAAVSLGVAVAVLYRGTREDVYNILWAVVFGFATLNILSLAARRFEPSRRGLTFGELMAVMVVLLSIFLLGWEMLNLFHVFPVKIRR
jgi:3-oxoacyl-(acyl-carrier-protein) synthase